MKLFETNSNINAPTAFDAEQLTFYINHPPSQSVTVIITPELAEAMLYYNNRNRPVKTGKVEQYKTQMLEGKWKTTRVPIIFSTQRIIDGQHRLMAIIESGVTITADIVFGAPDESFAYIDIGAKRSTSDIFAINGVVNSVKLSAMARIIWQYDRGGRGSITGNGSDISSADLYQEFLKMANIEQSLRIVSMFKRTRLASPTLMGALHYICARKSRKDADYFFSVACDGGAERIKNAPETVLHKRLILNATSIEKLSRDSIARLTFSLWNRYRLGRSGANLSIKDVKIPAVQ